jgi:hypothetical protein
MNMTKRLVLAAILALQFAVVCGVASADMPWPRCGPCPADDGVSGGGASGAGVHQSFTVDQR